MRKGCLENHGGMCTLQRSQQLPVTLVMHGRGRSLENQKIHNH